jgi:aspartyl-tRNA synthetase
MRLDSDPRILGTGLRTTVCGNLSADDIGKEVVICGWVAHRREHGEHLAFVDLRDATGIVQCVVDGSVEAKPEWVLEVKGTVRARPGGTANANISSGEVELGDCEVTVLSQAEPTPFPISEYIDADESVRLRYRYLDLRRGRLANNLRTRAKVNSAVRTAMEALGFLEVETPLLIASTPEGARDFVVPSRLKHGSWYALPQSPQLFKQLCMVGGLDRYYQIAKCLRDEDLRADRQFEFTQLDIEASFVSQEDVMEFVSEAVLSACEAVAGTRPVDEIPKMTWHEAMERFGSDKPDVRFGMELVEATPVFAKTEANVFKANCVKAIRVEGGAEFTRSRIDQLTEFAKRLGAKGLAWVKVASQSTLDGGVSKLLSETEAKELIAVCNAGEGDLLLLVADERNLARTVLGHIRLEIGKPPVTEGGLNFLWVVDFPLFEDVGEDGRPVPAHHPFTMPHVDDIDKLETDPLSVRSQAYDLVCNGWELGSGSIRIHRREFQAKIFELLGISEEEQQTKFGFLLDAFRFGPPPHGGFAVGLDRLTALLAGEENIREVIAFPKTQSGLDPLTNAPTDADDKHLRELGLQKLPKPK